VAFASRAAPLRSMQGVELVPKVLHEGGRCVHGPGQTAGGQHGIDLDPSAAEAVSRVAAVRD